jgi:hypothetical protein
VTFSYGRQYRYCKLDAVHRTEKALVFFSPVFVSSVPGQGMPVRATHFACRTAMPAGPLNKTALRTHCCPSKLQMQKE